MQVDAAIPRKRGFSWYGWLGLGLAISFWVLNWSLRGLRTHYLFFGMWLGYCLVMDALTLKSRGTSLLMRNWRRYASLFLISAPIWWIFELINLRLENWHYAGAESFSIFAFWLWATLNFTTVIPAVFTSAEWISSFKVLDHLKKGLRILPDPKTTIGFFVFGLVSFILMWVWPGKFFPFVWISLFCMLEPVNIWLGNRSLGKWTEKGDWRPVAALWGGVLLTAFFWELWNYWSYPKWIYHVPWGDCCHIFEMPLLGYGGYLPFALELFAFYHFVTGFWHKSNDSYVQFDFE